jgi:hypothetical protein
MTLFSLGLGLFRGSLILLPIIATLLTTADSSNAITLYLLWTFSYLRGIGYDFIRETYGFEADLWVLLFVILKTAALIDYSSRYATMWVVVLGMEVLFRIASRLPGLKPYLLETAFSPHEKPIKSTKQLYPLSCKETLVLLAVTFVYQATRVILLSSVKTVPTSFAPSYTVTTSPLTQTSLANNPLPDTTVTTLNAETATQVLYYPSVPLSYSLDYNQLYATVVETAASALFVLRVPSLTDLTHTTDFYLTGGGVYLLYVFLQACPLAPLLTGHNTSDLLIATLVGVPILLFTLLGLEGLSSASHGSTDKKSPASPSYPRAIWRGIWHGLREIARLLTHEPVLLVLYVILCAIVAFSLSREWYTTKIEFNGLIPELTCGATGFIEEFFQPFYVVTGSEPFQRFLIPVVSNIGFIRIKMAQIIQVAYPVLATGCDGAISTFTPSHNMVSLLFLLLTFLPAVCIVLIVFVEMELLVRRPSFWIGVLSINIVSFLVTQLASDTSAVIFYFLMDTTYNRSYTSSGAIVFFAQLALLLVCGVLFFRKQKENQARIGARFTAVIRDASAILFSPGCWFLGVAVVVLIYSIAVGGSPFANVSVARVQATSNSKPAWLVTTSTDQFGGTALRIVAFFGQKALIVVQLLNVVQYFIGQIPVIHIPMPPKIPDIYIGIGSFFSDAISGLSSLLETAFEYAASEVVLGFKQLNITIGGLNLGVLIDQLDSIMLALPHLDFALDFDLFNIEGHLPQFRFPTWIGVLVCVLAAVLVVFLVLALLFTGIRGVTQLISGLTVSLLVWFVVFLARLKTFLDGLSYSVAVEFTSTAYLYLASVTLGIVGVLMLSMGSEVTRAQTAVRGQYTVVQSKNRDQQFREMQQRNQVVEEEEEEEEQ